MSDLPHKTTFLPFALCASVLLMALLTGGGTHSGFLGDVATEILSIPLLIVALWPVFEGNGARKEPLRAVLVVCAICTALVFIQLLPLPFDVWAGRRVILESGDETRFGDLQHGWSTLSLTPQATWAAAVSLLVPLSVFASVTQLSGQQRITLCWLILAFGALSLLLGFLQVAQGTESPLRFYSFTNPTEAVGFFANRNHFAAFMNVTLILSGVWLTQTIEVSLRGRVLSASSFFWLAAAAVFFVAIVAGLAMARSRAGAFLAILVLAGIIMMIFRHNRLDCLQEDFRRQKKTNRVSVAVAVFAVLFALQVGLGRLLERFDADPADDLRIPLNVTTFATALKALPFGTGLGSFVSVYATAEKSQDATSEYANRAHDDFAEFFLETGLIGIALGAAFLLWFGRILFAVWVKGRLDGLPVDILLARASSLIIIVLLLHSLTDYPLRTTALGALFAFFCGILAAPARSTLSEMLNLERPSRRKKVAATPIPVEIDDLSWPESWRHRDAAAETSPDDGATRKHP